MDASRNEEIISQWWNQLKHLIAHPRLLVLHEHLYFAALNAQNASTYGPTSSSLQVTEAIKFLSRTIEVQSDMTRSIVTEVQKFSRLIKEGDVTRDESIIDKMSFRMAISMISLAQKKRELNFGTVSSGSGLLVDILRNWTPQSAFLFPHLAHEDNAEVFLSRFEMNEDDEAHYASEFNKLTNGIVGFGGTERKRELISLEEAMRFFQVSGLSQQELLEIMYLVKSAFLEVSLENVSKEEFCIDMHLIACRSKRGLRKLPLDFPFALFTLLPNLGKGFRGCNDGHQNLQNLTSASSLISLLDRQLENTKGHLRLVKLNCAITEQIMSELHQYVSELVQQLGDLGMSDTWPDIVGCGLELTMEKLNQITGGMRAFMERERTSIRESEHLSVRSTDDTNDPTYVLPVKLVHELSELRQKRKSLEELHSKVCEELQQQMDKGADYRSVRSVSDQLLDSSHSLRHDDCDKKSIDFEVKRDYLAEDAGIVSNLPLHNTNSWQKEKVNTVPAKSIDQGSEAFFVNFDDSTFSSADVMHSQKSDSCAKLDLDDGDFAKSQDWGKDDVDEAKRADHVKPKAIEQTGLTDTSFFNAWESSTFQAFGKGDDDTRTNTLSPTDVHDCVSMHEIRSVKDFLPNYSESIEYGLKSSAFADKKLVHGIPLDGGNDIDLNVLGERALDISENTQKTDKIKDNASMLLATPAPIRETSRLSERLRNRATLITKVDDSIALKSAPFDQSSLFSTETCTKDEISTTLQDENQAQKTNVKLKALSFECDFGEFEQATATATFGSFESSTNIDGLEFASFQAFESAPNKAFDTSVNETMAVSEDTKPIDDKAFSAFGSFEINSSEFESFGDFEQASDLKSPSSINMDNTVENWSSFATPGVPTESNIWTVDDLHRTGSMPKDKCSSSDDFCMETFAADSCDTSDAFQEPQVTEEENGCHVIPEGDQSLYEASLEAPLPEFTFSEVESMLETDASELSFSTANVSNEEPKLSTETKSDENTFDATLTLQSNDLESTSDSIVDPSPVHEKGPKEHITTFDSEYLPPLDDLAFFEAQPTSDTFRATGESIDFIIERNPSIENIFADTEPNSADISRLQSEDSFKTEDFAETIAFDTVDCKTNEINIMDAIETKVFSEPILEQDGLNNDAENDSKESRISLGLLDEADTEIWQRTSTDGDGYNDLNTKHQFPLLDPNAVTLETEPPEAAQLVNFPDFLELKAEELPRYSSSLVDSRNTDICIDDSHIVDELPILLDLVEAPPGNDFLKSVANTTDTQEEINTREMVSFYLPRDRHHVSLVEVAQADQSSDNVDTMPLANDVTKATNSADGDLNTRKTLIALGSSNDTLRDELVHLFEKCDDQALIDHEPDAAVSHETIKSDETGDNDASACLFIMKVGQSKMEDVEAELGEMFSAYTTAKLNEIEDSIGTPDCTEACNATQEEMLSVKSALFASIDELCRLASKERKNNATSDDFEPSTFIVECESEKTAKRNVEQSHLKEHTDASTQELTKNGITDDEAFEKLMEQVPFPPLLFTEDVLTDNFEFEHDQVASIMRKQSARKNSNPFANKSAADVAKAVDDLIGHCESLSDDESLGVTRKLTLEEVSNELERMTLDVA
ncbi:hypothetical protein ABG067_005066 [Albugo candida]